VIVVRVREAGGALGFGLGVCNAFASPQWGGAWPELIRDPRFVVWLFPRPAAARGSAYGLWTPHFDFDFFFPRKMPLRFFFFFLSLTRKATQRTEDRSTSSARPAI
jgi:hypothetical protein